MIGHIIFIFIHIGIAVVFIPGLIASIPVHLIYSAIRSSGRKSANAQREMTRALLARQVNTVDGSIIDREIDQEFQGDITHLKQIKSEKSDFVKFLWFLAALPVLVIVYSILDNIFIF